MKLNTKVAPIYTHEGAKASHINAEQQLRRSVMACMLWEDQFYEDGKSIADRIAELVPKVKPETVQQIAIEARTLMKLRHVPLLLTYAMTKSDAHKSLVADTLAQVIQRADELTEYCAMYFALGGKTLSAQSKKGLARAISKFNEYELAKYNRDGKFKLRDVLFLCHSKPSDAPADKYTKDHRKNGAQRILTSGEVLYRKLTDNALQTPDTWEVALSGGADKKEAFTRLMAEGKLGALAFLRNLRNMAEAGISKSEVAAYMAKVDLSKVLPFRFVAAAAAVPQWEDVIDSGFLRSTAQAQKLPGKTVLIVDVSGSMYGAGNISKHSDMSRVHAAGALAAIAREICEESSIYATAGDDYKRIHATAQVPPRHGMALVDTFTKRGYAAKLGGGGIFLKQCMDFVFDKEKKADRVIVLTDEQDCDQKLNPDTANAFGRFNYIINVASNKNGVAYGKFHHINGWSESCIDYIRAYES